VKLPLLTYLPLRGRAELIRLVLAEAGMDYQEHPVTQGTPPMNGRPTDFAELKAGEWLPFQALPVWEDPDGFRLAQSQAIVRYLSKKHGFMGQTPREEALVDQVLGVYDDVRPEIRKLMTVPAEERSRTRGELKDLTLPRWLRNMDRLLAANHDGTGFVVGEGFTVADLVFWYLHELIRDNGFQSLLDRHPRLVAHAQRISLRPRLQAWVASDRRPKFIPPPG
jgi:glutathione S-transferase